MSGRGAVALGSDLFVAVHDDLVDVAPLAWGQLPGMPPCPVRRKEALPERVFEVDGAELLACDGSGGAVHLCCFLQHVIAQLRGRVLAVPSKVLLRVGTKEERDGGVRGSWIPPFPVEAST